MRIMSKDTIWTNCKRPSDRIFDVLSGKRKLEDEDKAIQSACRIYIYQGACSVLSLPDIDMRRRALAKLPPLIRPNIETEINRLWKDRKNDNSTRPANANGNAKRQGALPLFD